MNMSSTILAHHGLVTGMYDELGIGQLIDEALPNVGPHKLPSSTSLKAMVINALGFNPTLVSSAEYFSPVMAEYFSPGLINITILIVTRSH